MSIMFSEKQYYEPKMKHSVCVIDPSTLNQWENPGMHGRVLFLLTSGSGTFHSSFTSFAFKESTVVPARRSWKLDRSSKDKH